MIVSETLKNIAAVAGVILTGVGVAVVVATYLKSLTKVVVTAKPHPFTYPASIAKLLDLGARALAHRSSKILSPPAVPSAADDLVNQFAVIEGEDIAYPSSIRVLWELRVVNRGHDIVEDAEIHFNQGLMSVTSVGPDQTSVQVGPIVRVKELRPGHEVSITVWTSYAFNDEPKLYLKKGKGKVLVYAMLPPTWQSLETIWRTQKPATIFVVLVWVAWWLARP